MKNIDVAVANLVRDFVNGDYKGGEVKNGTLANNGVGLASTTDKNVSEKILKYVDETYPVNAATSEEVDINNINIFAAI